MKFTHLHSHTDASLQDGMGTVGSFISAAKTLGFDHVAMTDHGTLANAVSFTLEAKEVGIKPLLGLEGYLIHEGKIGHITLLADGDHGFKNIVRLNNLGHASNNKQPAFTVNQLIDHSNDVIMLTGCQASPFQTLPLDEAVALGAQLKPHFPERMFIELMFIGDENKTKRGIQLRKRLKLPYVITNDTHMPLSEHTKIHPILTKMRAGFTYNSQHLFLKTPEQMLAAATKYMPEHLAKPALHLAWEIGENLREVNLAASPSLPHVPGSHKWLEEQVLSKASLEGPRYEERVRFELDIINKMGYSAYFYILHDLVEYGKAHGVRIGPGRGSGAGSLVLFLLGITQIDPLVYNLSFERFLNPHRKGMPDVDIDFDAERRGIVLEYASKKWGAVPIATYSRYAHKILTHDLSKQLRVPRELDAKAADSGPDSKAFKEVVENFEEFGPAYNIISGQIRHRGTHAGGVVITDQVVPIERSGKSLSVSWVEGKKNELSYAGFVKFDLLGLTALSALRRMEKQTGEVAPFPPVDLDPAFSIFRNGNLDGIFQFSGSEGIRELTVKLQPTSFGDLVAINALYRPGALDVGATDKFPEWKKTPRKVNPLIEDILAETYGAIVYQEQVMAIFARITDGDLAAADNARRVIVKSKAHDLSWVKKFTELKRLFIEGCLKKSISRTEGEHLWEELAAHSRYSFNKSHSVSYARIAWELAWFKYNYPAEFFCSILNVDKPNGQAYLVSAVESGIDVVMPHVNVSSDQYEIGREGGVTKLFMPLSEIKFLSQTAAKAIVSSRDVDGDFKSAKDFMKRIPKKVCQGRARAGLYALQGFRGMPATPKTLEIKADVVDFDDEPTEIQRKFLGIFVPLALELDKIKSEKAAGRVAGIVASTDKRRSNYGPYTVYRLVPFGVFWVRKAKVDRDIEIGDLVSATVTESTGRALTVKHL